MKKWLLLVLIQSVLYIEAASAEGAYVKLPPIKVEVTDKLKRGESINAYFQKIGFNKKDAHLLSYKLNKKYKLRKMRTGQKLVSTFIDNTELKIQNRELERLQFYTPNDTAVSLYKDEDGYAVETFKRKTTSKRRITEGTIKSSLYVAADEADFPAALIADMVDPFAWDIDFTRDFRKGDSFKVIYEQIMDSEGNFLRNGSVLAAELNLKRRGKLRAYRYKTKKGRISYYNENGESRRRSLLRTPLKFSRISSHFNPKRKHPVLGYTRAHKGTDFAAPTGTPIRAAGDGRIVKRSWFGGYGRYIRIRHNGKYETAYAHLSRYKRGVKAGSYVRQGQIIGYVGTSGRSTGPHLHYELIIHGKKTNAMRAKLPKGKKLAKSEMANFRDNIAEMDNLWQSTNKIAQKK